jgi:hypothetical protein
MLETARSELQIEAETARSELQIEASRNGAPNDNLNCPTEGKMPTFICSNRFVGAIICSCAGLYVETARSELQIEASQNGAPNDNSNCPTERKIPTFICSNSFVGAIICSCAGLYVGNGLFGITNRNISKRRTE